MEFWKRAVILFGKTQAFFEAGVDSSVLDCFLSPLGLCGDVRVTKLPAPTALAPRLAMLATAVGFNRITPPNGINQRFPKATLATETPGTPQHSPLQNEC